MINVQGPRILVKPEKVEEVDETYKRAKAAGIEIHRGDEFKREERAVTFGKVVATTPLCWQAPVGDGTPWCKVGDHIIYAQYAGKWVEDPHTKEEYMFLNDEDVLGVVTKEME